MGVNYILTTVNLHLHLGKKSTNVKTMVLGSWEDLLIIILGKTNLWGQGNGYPGVWWCPGGISRGAGDVLPSI